MQLRAWTLPSFSRPVARGGARARVKFKSVSVTEKPESGPTGDTNNLFQLKRNIKLVTGCRRGVEALVHSALTLHQTLFIYGFCMQPTSFIKPPISLTLSPRALINDSGCRHDAELSCAAAAAAGWRWRRTRASAARTAATRRPW